VWESGLELDTYYCVSKEGTEEQKAVVKGNQIIRVRHSFIKREKNALTPLCFFLFVIWILILKN
jgi:hypothetical protein